MSKIFTLIKKETLFQGYYALDRYKLQYQKFNGQWSNSVDREVFERGHAVGVLLYDPIINHVGLIEQFRPGAVAAQWYPWLIEIVAGIVQPGEILEEVAIRETKEEAGLDIFRLKKIYSYLVTPGASSETMHLFCAHADLSNFGGTHGLDSENEDIRAFSLSIQEAYEWVKNSKIVNSATIIALQWLELNAHILQKEWSKL
jgi:ADP-ribose pyrophosphatase